MKLDKEFEKFLIRGFNNWDLFIHPDQGVLGRCYLWCKRENAEDFIEMNQKEVEEFFEIVKKLKDTLNQLFQPDIYNYSALQNKTTHLHVHILPRYSTPREFEGKLFEDKHWGNAHRTNLDFDLEEEILLTIKNTIQNHLD